MIRLASYNIRKAVGLDWIRRPMRVARAIAEVAPDIIAMQEADRRFGSRASALTREAVEHTGLVPVETDVGPNLGWHGNAILVRPGWTVSDVRQFDLLGLEPRGALVARIETPEGHLTLCATHLGLARASRIKQMNLLIEHLGPDMSEVAILADMNEWSLRTGVEPLVQSGLALYSPGPSFHTTRPVANLDRIALGSKWQIGKMGVHRTKATSRASDHLPVWAEIEAAKR
ncbi:endonuclease/exonuclease/phosphatase family protein [Palleronia abyssalis]|uniref:Endonuclease/exonuclease/phosphatase domain-containing protein n=1 Tax=Palleronia abyssalis TaxID=1501240 RepID=A0A2R8BY91_9RHOB|nr:endonuclease/exonuclease/phosphatase family protein [Palleronia abyssalis]SPJ25148.1 hypothetical protein PAA8504_02995 [Palleronia abyssalis]